MGSQKKRLNEPLLMSTKLNNQTGEQICVLLPLKRFFIQLCFNTLQEPLGDVWSVNTLDRATRTGKSTYTRAIARKIEWPKPKEEPKPSVVRKRFCLGQKKKYVCLLFDENLKHGR